MTDSWAAGGPSYVRLWRDDAPVVDRHVPFVALFAVASALYFVPGQQLSSPVLLSVAILLMISMIAAAIWVPWDRVVYGARDALVLIEFAAVGFLVSAGGSGWSFATPLLFIPVVVLSAGRGRRPVVMASAAAFLALMAPLALGQMRVEKLSDVVPFVFTLLTVVIASLTVNVLVDRLRNRSVVVEQLRARQEELVSLAQHDAERIHVASERLRESRDLMAGVIEAVTEQSIIGTDDHGLIQVFNQGAEHLLGIPRREAIGRRLVTDFHVPGELEARGGGFAALVGGAIAGEAEVRDWTYVTASGDEMTVQLAVTRRTDNFGDRTGYLFVATDITAEREVARLKDEFVSLISHELRTPLSSILGYLELVTDEEEGDTLTEEQRAYLAIVERNANRLLHLVGDLLFTAQVEAGRFVLNRSDVDVRALVIAAVDSARPVAEAAGIEMTQLLPHREVRVEADPLRIAQALDNLISNAVKFTPRGGTVSVEVRAGRVGEGAVDGAVVTVVDTGIGIPDEEVGQLFGRFFRASTATRAVVPGTGLGLSITKAIITAHGGELSVTSEVGKGTSFGMSLPRQAPEHKAQDLRPL